MRNAHRSRRKALMVAAASLLIGAGCEDGGKNPLTPGQTVASVEVLPASTSLLEFETRSLQAKPKTSDGRVVAGRAVSWSSSDSTVATVDHNGVVTGRQEGQVVISATSEGRTGRSTITIGRAPVAAVEIIGDSVRAVRGGESVQLIAIPRDAGGNTLNMRPPTWSSSDPAIAFVTSSGGVVARRLGEAYVTAEVEGVTARVLIRVNSDVVSIEIDPQHLHLDVGSALPIRAVVRTDRNPGLSRPVTWTVEDGTIARVDRALGDRVVGLRPGTTRITATVEDRTAHAWVTVTERHEYQLETMDGSTLPVAVHESTYPDENGNIRTYRWELVSARLVLSGGMQRYMRQFRFRVYDDGEFVGSETLTDQGEIHRDLPTSALHFRSEDPSVPLGRGWVSGSGEFTLKQRDSRDAPERTYVFRQR
jgi:uncharacterized protein YjdB